jgi:hypothetical protein
MPGSTTCAGRTTVVPRREGDQAHAPAARRGQGELADLYPLGSAKPISGSLTNGTWDIHGRHSQPSCHHDRYNAPRRSEAESLQMIESEVWAGSNRQYLWMK